MPTENTAFLTPLLRNEEQAQQICPLAVCEVKQMEPLVSACVCSKVTNDMHLFSEVSKTTDQISDIVATLNLAISIDHSRLIRSYCTEHPTKSLFTH